MTTILEGKYWKRRAEAVIAEYKKWRMFHIMRLLGKGDTAVQDNISDMDTVLSFSQCSDLAENMLTDEDYLNFMSDTLFTTITNHQPFAFPDCREIARGASLADFIQPSLGPLQPNLDDFMDTLEPLQELFSATPRLPPVPEESALPSEDSYRSGMSVDTYGQSYIAISQSNAVTMPTSQGSLHGGTSSNTQMMVSGDSVKSEQLRYESARMFGQEMPAMMSEMGVYSYDDAHMPNVFAKRSQPTKIVPQSEPYYKYNTGVPPSQTAPETVTLLQQPVQNPKYTSIGAGRGYSARDKPRLSRGAHYGPQYAAVSYAPPAPGPARPVEQRQSSPQLQYLQPAEGYKPKPPQNNTRPFKMPSPPLAPSPTQHHPLASVNSPASGSRPQEQYRSHSLPLGAHLNADWSLAAPPTTTPPSHELQRRDHTPRPRESTSSVRMRSRSTSGGVGAGEGGGGRLPPPLNSVASEPSLPQASVMLAQLLSAQHSKSSYKLNSSTEEGLLGTDPTRSPIRKGQPSPIGSDVMSPHQSLSPPTSPGSPRAGSPREPRRTHLHAEQKRRYNIKNGFDTLQALIPHLNANPAAKISKAAMLQKGAEYIKLLKAERNQIKEEMESLKQQTESLNNSISNCHSMLPATGAPVSRARAGRLREMFARHVANRTMHNWKYWLFSVVAAALVDSFSACVSCGSGADLVRTTLLWAEQHCSLVEMRPAVLNSLRVLCTTTDILTNPERLPEEARQAVAASAGVKSEPT
ncbi:unnamed protein product [Chilo suppressalis]|uniref:BHLH domain-containing protein n=1 Tax=Chilo suppressalis TaxID=168631 RepID=A0ABN8LH00_CHISP|nr:unnamed protein product [Chilo suppressalis]